MITNRTRVAHVFRRLGFGPSPTDLDTWSAQAPTALIGDLLARPAVVPTPAQPNPWGFPTGTDYIAEDAFGARMLTLMAFGPGSGGVPAVLPSTYNALQERMAWILHGLLVVAVVDSVYYPDLVDHVTLLRSSCFGSYKQLLSSVSTRPGMLKYLNGNTNSSASPNQNYARELMELFSLGRVAPLTGSPNYAQDDIMQIARALTGWRYNWSTGATYFDPLYWDAGPKTFLGQPRGAAKLADVIDAIVGHPAFSYYVPARLYQELVGLPPTPEALEDLADAWGPDGDLSALVAAIVARPEFLSDQALFAKVKQPVEWIASAARLLGFPYLEDSNFYLSWRLKQILAQHPLHAPNVGGWPRGDQWLGAGNLAAWCETVKAMIEYALPRGGLPFVSRLRSEASGATAADHALYLAGLEDASVLTRSKLDAYAQAGSWSKARAAGVAMLLLVSPEFLVN